MRIALIITGEIREFKECFKTLFKFLSNYTYDIFMVTWDESIDKTNKMETINIDEIKNIYKPIYLEILSKEVYNKNIKKFFIGDNFNIQWYLYLRCFIKLKEYSEKNDIIYNAVIKTRPDILYNNILNISDLDLTSVYSSYTNNKLATSIIKFSKPRYQVYYEKLKQFHSTLIDVKIEEKYFSIFDIPNISCDCLKYTANNRKILAVCDWTFISNFNNMEILSHSFLFYILFHVQHNYKYMTGTKRVLLYEYTLSMNNLRYKILPEQYKHYTVHRFRNK